MRLTTFLGALACATPLLAEDVSYTVEGEDFTPQNPKTPKPQNPFSTDALAN